MSWEAPPSGSCGFSHTTWYSSRGSSSPAVRVLPSLQVPAHSWLRAFTLTLHSAYKTPPQNIYVAPFLTSFWSLLGNCGLKKDFSNHCVNFNSSLPVLFFFISWILTLAYLMLIFVYSLSLYSPLECKIHEHRVYKTVLFTVISLTTST